MNLEKWLLTSKVLFLITLIVMYFYAPEDYQDKYFQSICAVGTKLLFDTGKKVNDKRKKKKELKK